MTDTNRPEAVHDVLRDMRQWKGDYSVFADRIERALSARASAGEGGVTDEMVERGTRIAYGDQPRDACGMRMRKDIRKILEGALHPQESIFTAAPQPAQAGASGGGDVAKPLGYVLESDLAQLDANDSGTIWPFPAEATDQISGKRCGSVPVYLAPASPATGEGDSSDIPFGTVQKVVRALTRLGVSTPCSQEEQAARSVELVNDLCREVQEYFDSITAAPQAASVQGEPVVWRKPTPYGVGYNFASKEVMEDIAGWIQESFITPQPAAAHPELPSAQGWLDSHCAVATTEWMRGWDAARSALAAAAPRPQEDEKARRPCPRCDTCNDLIVIGYCRDCARTVADAAEDTPPAHGDGEGDYAAKWFAECRRVLEDVSTEMRATGRGDTRFRRLIESMPRQRTTRPTPEAQEARDAERYRWLRENADIEDVFYGDRVKLVIPAPDIDGFNDLNDVIDAALALPAQGEG